MQNSSAIKSNDVPKLYAGWTNDRELLLQSTSGGVFSEIARDVIEEGGVVFGAAYDETMTVRHIAVESWDNLRVLRGSKYVQSDVGDTYQLVAKYLEAGKHVLYSGTPCQIAGLQNAIGKDHKNLLTCELICKGVPSPKVLRMAVKSVERRHGSKVVDVLFREKSFGWLHPSVRIDFADGTFIHENSIDNHFNLGFQKNIYLRPTCYRCPIKLSGSMADITLGDFWQLLKFQPSLINRLGTSAVLVNTERGRQVIRHCKERMSLKECQFAIIENNSNLRKSVKPSPEREAFFADIDHLSFEELTQKHLKPRGALLRQIARIRRMSVKWIEAWK